MAAIEAKDITTMERDKIEMKDFLHHRDQIEVEDSVIIEEKNK